MVNIDSLRATGKALAASIIWAPIFIFLTAATPLKGIGHYWDFEGAISDLPLRSLAFIRAGSGQPGRWVVQEALDAPSGIQVLAQLSDDRTDYRFPMAIADGPLLKNLQVSVKCKLISGKTDQSCGAVFRYSDQNNYYVVRADALEQDVRLFKVIDGSRKMFAVWKGPVPAGVWHELRVKVRRRRFTVFWDGKQIVESADKAFPRAGKTGLWTKADSVTYFDDFEVEQL